MRFILLHTHDIVSRAFGRINDLIRSIDDRFIIPNELTTAIGYADTDGRTIPDHIDVLYRDP